MSAHTYADLVQHTGHTLECVTYGDPAVNVAVECLDCCEVIVDFDREPEPEPEPDVDLSRIHLSGMATCDHRDNATCLRCGLDWCHECDPGPAALCPVCHGRGYSTATWNLPIGASELTEPLRNA